MPDDVSMVDDIAPRADLIDRARDELTDFAESFNRQIHDYWKAEYSRESGYTPTQRKLIRTVLDHVREYMLRPAKRVRPALVKYGYLLTHDTVSKSLSHAYLAVELVQTALLMHDDFEDGDTQRRGGPSTGAFFGVHDRHFGDSMAVDIGDIALCLGFEQLALCHMRSDLVNRASAILARGIADTAYGQAFDISLGKLVPAWDEDDIIALHRSKTSLYTFHNPLFVGALLGDAPPHMLPHLENYATNAGVAFQLHDDVLGVFGDTSITGKSSDSDLLQGKCTLLIARLRSHGTASQVETVMKVWGHADASTTDISHAKQALRDSGAYDYCVEASHTYTHRAVDALRELARLGARRPALDFLEGLALYVVDRDM